ncbi:MAG: hypothetical protein PHT02_03335 [Tissierellia bacterium]|nr:hypothetical protein [Tissierellia bacterium]
MVNKFDIDIKINKEILFEKLKFIKNTESYKNADEIFGELSQIIIDNMKLTCLYSVVDDINDLPLFKIIDCKINKIVICFLSSNDIISHIINDFINEGSYLKGYLLNEIATYVIFNTSNEMNKEIKRKLLALGYALTKRYAPGDGGVELKYQQVILDTLKKDVNIDVHLTENYMIVPEKSMTYFFGALKIKDNCDNYLNENNYNNKSCRDCTKLNCQYRNIQ